MKREFSRANFGDVRVCTACGETNLQNLIKVSSIHFDPIRGTFEAGNIRGPATDIMNISVTFTPRQTKRLCLLTKKGEVIAMESEPKRVVFGYGKTGKQIDLFQRVLPGLVEAAKKQELRDQ